MATVYEILSVPPCAKQGENEEVTLPTVTVNRGEEILPLPAVVKDEEQLLPLSIEVKHEEEQILLRPAEVKHEEPVLLGPAEVKHEEEQILPRPAEVILPQPTEAIVTRPTEVILLLPSIQGQNQEDVDLVADLITTPFSTKTYPEKMDILRRGRPTPTVTMTQQGRGFTRHFQVSNYERYPWLTSSEKHCKLYCWECLLFAGDRSGVWCSEGFANLGCLTKAATRHQSTAGHLKATVLCKTFGETRVNLQPNDQVRRETQLHNERVKKNREILKTMIGCVVFLGKQGLAFRGNNGNAESTNKGNHMELLNLLAENMPDLQYHLTTNKVFTGTAGQIQNDLIDAIAEVMEEEIKAEVKKAPFVAVMVDETADVDNAAQLSFVLRYVTDMGVKERFIRFEDVSGGQRADDIAALILRYLEEYGCSPDKVVAQCYDGTPVLASGINGVQARVKQRAPLALFLHSYAHRLNLVLTQGTSKIKECKFFFATLDGFAKFFIRSTKRSLLLDDACKCRLPKVVPKRWQYTSGLIKTLIENRSDLKGLFDHIMECHEDFDADTLLAADGFNARLDDFEFCFLLQTFYGIFNYSDALCAVLQKKPSDVQFCLTRVNDFCTAVEGEKCRFSEIYEATEHVSDPSTRRGVHATDPRTHYQQLHGQILDNLVSQVRNRFQDHEKLMFLSLVEPQHFRAYQRKFPQAAFSSLTESHATLFDMPRLKTELTVMYETTDFHGKSPSDLLDFLKESGLSGDMSQLYALVCVAVTIPVSTASVQRAVSASKRIKMYSRKSSGQTGLSSLAVMSIEKDLLLDLKRKDRLYDRVIDAFLRKKRRVDFEFK